MQVSTRDLHARDERVRAAYDAFMRGDLTRREFVRYAAVMGLSLAGLEVMGCAPPRVSQATSSVPNPTSTTEPRPASPMPSVGPALLASPTPVPTATSGIRRGGKLVSTLNYSTQRFTDPAVITTTLHANVIRQVCDWLVRVGPDLVVRPALATKWLPSEDGLTWTVSLRQGVQFNNGKMFNADDVVFTFERLLKTGTSSAFRSVANYLPQTGAIEKVDEYTVAFHCTRKVADFPYHLHDYHAAILPKDWPGDFYKAPWGTGPFIIKEYRPDISITYRRREDYWRIGADNKSLPYLDELEYVSYPDDASWLAALKKGQIQLGALSLPQVAEILKMPDIRPLVFQTGNFYNGVLRCDEKPFDNPQVREAFKLTMDRGTYIKKVLLGYGIPAYDQPISPLYPLAPTIKPVERNVEKAKALLKEAGYPNGIQLKVKHPTDDGHTNFALWLQNAAAPAGFNVVPIPDPNYYQTWLKSWGENVLGVDDWAMRATPSEFFNIAFKSNGDWNETHWSNKRFDELLIASDAELDPVKRKAQYQEMCDLISSDGGLVAPSYRQDLQVMARSLQGWVPSPIVADYYDEVWLEQ